MTLAFIFPGQGSQEIGMGKALAEAFPAARAVFEEVNAALGQDLSGLMWGGDLAELTLTSNTQPALMAHSVAAYRALEAAEGTVARRLLGAAWVVSVAEASRTKGPSGPASDPYTSTTRVKVWLGLGVSSTSGTPK